MCSWGKRRGVNGYISGKAPKSLLTKPLEGNLFKRNPIWRCFLKSIHLEKPCSIAYSLSHILVVKRFFPYSTGRSRVASCRVPLEKPAMTHCFWRKWHLGLFGEECSPPPPQALHCSPLGPLQRPRFQEESGKQEEAQPGRGRSGLGTESQEQELVECRPPAQIKG